MKTRKSITDQFLSFQFCRVWCLVFTSCSYIIFQTYFNAEWATNSTSKTGSGQSAL